MNNPSLSFIRTPIRTLSLGCLVGHLMLSGNAHASDATWNVTTAGAWGTGANWLPAASPGSTSGNTSPDTATFNNATGVTVTVDTNRNIKNITFDGAAGTYTLSSGSLILTNGGALTLTSAATTSTTETVSAPITLAGNYTFVNNAASTTGILRASGTITGATGTTSTLTLDGTNTGSNLISGVVANGASGGVTSIVKTGAGTWSLSGANSFSGGLSINTGGVTFSNAGTAANSAITVGQSGVPGNTSLTVSPNAAGTKTISSSLTYNGSFNSGGSNFTVKGTSAGNSVSNFGNLTLGSGELSGSMTPNGAGNVQAQFSGVTHNSGTQMVFTSASLGTATIASATANTSNIIFTSAPTLTGGGGSAGTNTVSLLPWAFVGGNLATYDSTFGLRPLNTGTEMATLSTSLTSAQNANMGASTTTLNAATSVNALRMASSSSTLSFGTGLTGDTTSLTVASGAIVVGASSIAFGSVAGNGVLTFGAAEGNIHVASTRTLTVNSVITGTGGLTIGLDSGAGTAVVLAAANTYTGVTTFEGNNAASQVYLTHGLALQNSTLDYNNYGAAMTFGDSTATTAGKTAYTFGGLKGAQNITLANNNSTVQAVTVTVGGDGDSTTYSGVLSDGSTAGGAITKAGTGTLTLSGTNTYTGVTTIAGGKLALASSTSNNPIGNSSKILVGDTLAHNSASLDVSGISTAGGFQVRSGQTLAGHGTVLGGTTFLSGSTLSPGNSAGTTTFNGNLILNSGVSLVFDLASTGASDEVVVTGAGHLLTLNNQSISDFTFNLVSGYGAGTYILVDSSANGISGSLSAVPGSLTEVLGGYNATLSLNAGDVILTVAVVPEPGTWALMLGGLATLLVWQRRKGNLS